MMKFCILFVLLTGYVVETPAQTEVEKRIKDEMLKAYKSTHQVRRTYLCCNGKPGDRMDETFIKPFKNASFVSGYLVRFKPLDKNGDNFELVVYEFKDNQSAVSTLDRAIGSFHQPIESFDPFGKDYDYSIVAQNYIVRISFPCSTSKEKWKSTVAKFRKICTGIFKTNTFKNYEVHCGG